MIKALKGMPLYFENVEGIDYLDSKFLYLMINTPPICNYRCKKCFTKSSSREPKNTLKIEEILDLVSWGKEKGAKVVSILGEGEPMMFQHFQTIVKNISDQGMIPLFVTNGYLLNKSNIDFLFNNNAVIVVSLDTLNDKDYNEYCGGVSNLDYVLKNIKYARDRFNKINFVKNGCKVYHMAVHMTVTAVNYKNIGEIEEFCGDDLYFNCQGIAEVGDAILNKDFVGDADLNKYITKYDNTDKPMVIAKTENGDDVCALFYYGFAIGYEGEVMFDTHAVDSKVFGNIRDNDIEKLQKNVKGEIMEYFSKYKTLYCPVRDKNFTKFLQYLSKKYKK